jgi:hypothetical protein
MKVKINGVWTIDNEHSDGGPKAAGHTDSPTTLSSSLKAFHARFIFPFY